MMQRACLAGRCRSMLAPLAIFVLNIFALFFNGKLFSGIGKSEDESDSSASTTS